MLPCLLRFRQARDLPLQAAVREALAVVGYTDPVKGKGIRVLAIDGGGTRCNLLLYNSRIKPSKAAVYKEESGIHLLLMLQGSAGPADSPQIARTDWKTNPPAVRLHLWSEHR